MWGLDRRESGNSTRNAVYLQPSPVRISLLRRVPGAALPFSRQHPESGVFLNKPTRVDTGSGLRVPLDGSVKSFSRLAYLRLWGKDAK